MCAPLAAALLSLAAQDAPAPGYTIPIVDLAADTARQVVVDREAGQYLGHPTTVLLEDEKTMIAVYPKGHGRGAIVMKRSTDGGLTWSVNEVLSPSFNPLLGWPQQNKLGDYYDMVSTNDAAHVAYAATFNGEQDVYYLRIVTGDGAIFADGFESGDTSAWSAASP